MSTAAGQVTAPYGSWKSPITADVVSGANKELAGMALSTHARLLYLESRPADGGYLPQLRLPPPLTTTLSNNVEAWFLSLT